MSEFNEHEDTPLQKPKRATKEIKEEININDNDISIQQEKPKKPKTEKQIAQFQRLQQRKKELDEERKKQKKLEASKLLLENDYVLTEKKQAPKKDIKYKEPEPESDTEIEEEIIYVKKDKPKKKKKV